MWEVRERLDEMACEIPNGNISMKKICYVVTIPLTIKAFFIPQLQFLAAHGYDVTVICSPDDTLESELGGGIRYYPIEIPRGVSFWGSIRVIRELKVLFQREQFDLIQYSTPNAALYASIAAKRVGCKIRNYHLMGLRYFGAKGIGRLLLKVIEKITCNNSTSIECVSNSNMELGVREGLFKPEKVTVVWNGSTGGVDLDRFDYEKRPLWREEIRAELGYEKKDFVYGFVGRITRDKGVNELLTAFLNLNDDSKLFLIGDMEGENTLDSALLNEVRKNTNIQFHQAVMDIERYYATIDVLLLPSYREGLGNVVIEAGAVGTPAIITDIPGLIDTVDREKTAFVVPVKDADSLKEAMQRIRKDGAKVMGQAAMTFVRDRFDAKVLCEKILDRKKILMGER